MLDYGRTTRRGLRSRTLNSNMTNAMRKLVASAPCLVLLCALVPPHIGRAAPSPSDDSPCLPTKIGGSITEPEKAGSWSQEIAQKFRDHNQRDLRSYQQESVLRNAIACIASRLDALKSAISTNQGDARARRDGLILNLQEISETLTKLTRKVPTSVSVRVGESPLNLKLARAITAHLDTQDKAIAEVVKKLQQISSAPPQISVNAISDATAMATLPRADNNPLPQIDPHADLTNYFGRSKYDIEYALAAVPDPRVPRHRRQYDNAITAINLGMLRAGFVLDSFGFPWDRDLRPPTTTPNPSFPTGNRATEARPTSVMLDDRFGLMVFRRDSWRNTQEEGARSRVNSQCEVQVRAVYVVPEAATYGVQRAALQAAMVTVDEEFARANRCAGAGSIDRTASNEVTLFGPTFSGSLDSIREVMRTLTSRRPGDSQLRTIKELRLLAASPTVDTNAQVDGTMSAFGQRLIRYVPFSHTDREKLDYIAALRKEIGISADHVAVLYEATVFGSQACRAREDPRTREIIQPTLCKKAHWIPFPANIADVRFGLREKSAAHTPAPGSNLPVALAPDHLSLEDGAENGSEFPESQQSPLTATSTGLELDRMIAILKQLHAQIIVVIATDVRDRLFLIQQIGAQLPGPLFVDLDADRLLAHPDFIHATRGALTLSSAPLTSTGTGVPARRTIASPEALATSNSNDVQVWSTDEQATLSRAIDYWSQDPAPEERRTPNLVPYVVSRAGLISAGDMPSKPIVRYGQMLGSMAVAALCALFGLGLAWTYRTEATDGLTIGEFWSGGAPTILILGAAVILCIITNSVTIAIGAGIVALAILWWSANRTPIWAQAMMWVVTVLLATTMSFETIAAMRWLSARESGTPELRSLLSALSENPSGGLAYPLSECVAVAVLVVALWIARQVFAWRSRSDEALGGALPPAEIRELQQPARRSGLIALLIAIGGEMLALVLFVNQRQVTVFGLWVDLAAYSALVSTTLLGILMLIGALGQASRIDHVCGRIMDRLREKTGFEDEPKSSAQPLMWTDLQCGRPKFVATPVLTCAWSGGPAIKAVRAQTAIAAAAWKDQLLSLLTDPPPSSEGLKALYALLAMEICSYQLCIVGVALCTIGSSVIVYLFPVTQATAITVLNLLILLAAGAYAAYRTVQFEGNTILSNVLCNRPKARKWSPSLLAGVAIPFVALTIAIGIGQIPGVLDVGGGLIAALFRLIKTGELF